MNSMAKRKQKGVIRTALIIAGVLTAGAAGMLIAGQIALRHSGDVTINQSAEPTMLDQINAVRAKAGKSFLVQDQKLDKAAIDKVYDQINRNYWAHHLPGENTAQFAGPYYPGRYISENIAKCQTSDVQRVDNWIHSPSHYAAIIADVNAMGYAERPNPADNNCVYTVMYFIKN